MASCGNAECAREEERGGGPDLVHHAEGKEGGGGALHRHPLEQGDWCPATTGPGGGGQRLVKTGVCGGESGAGRNW
jgi:hypothetical protein